MAGRLCRVCGGPAAGALFGVDACRACAAFFRRASRDGKGFKCATGTEACDISETSDGRQMCKQCRFSRCLAAGMVMPGQPEITDSLIIQRDKYSILTTIRRNFKKLREDRITLEEETIAQSTENLKSFDTSSGPIYHATLDLMNDIVRKTLPLYGVFFESTFKSYAHFSAEEKTALFREFYGPFSNMDREYLSGKKLPSNEKKRMLSFMTYHDLTHAALPAANLDNSAFNLVHDRAQDALSLKFRETIRELAFDDTEYAAYSTLLMWIPDITLGCSDEVLDTCKEVQAKILRDLDYYYRTDVNLDEHAVRIGNILHVLSTLKKNVWRDREEVGMLRAFGCFDDFPSLTEMARVLEEGNTLSASSALLAAVDLTVPATISSSLNLL